MKEGTNQERFVISGNFNKLQSKASFKWQKFCERLAKTKWLSPIKHIAVGQSIIKLVASGPVRGQKAAAERRRQ